MITYIVAGASLLGLVVTWWWVAHSKPPAPAVPSVPTEDEKRIAWLQAAFPRGMAFEYLNRRMLPTGYRRLETRWVGEMHVLDYRPRLQAEYSDNHGVIHSHEFTYAEAVALKGPLAEGT